MHVLVRLGIVVIAVSLFLVSCDSSTERLKPPPQGEDRARDIGYSVLRKILKDEQHLKILRLAKTAITFQALSEPTKSLIDDIAATSSGNLVKLEQLATLNPPITFGESCPAMLDQAIINALRMTTAKDLVMTLRDDFELNLLISQIQALRITSHLLKELQNVDPNAKRQAWLENLSTRFEGFYRRAIARLSLADE